MDAVDVDGFLEFDCIILRDGVLESSEAVQQASRKKWSVTKESVEKCASLCSGEASDRVEGEVIYIQEEEEEDQDVDVEGDETSPVTRPPGSIQSQGVSCLDHITVLAEETKVADSPIHSEAVGSARPTCSLGSHHFSSEADRTDHTCVVTSEVQRPSQSHSYRRKGFAGPTSSGSSDVRKVARQEHGEPPKCRVLSAKRARKLGAENSADTSVTSGSEACSARKNTGSGHLPTFSQAGASALSETTNDTHVYVWKCPVGMCSVCGEFLNNHYSVKRHALIHDTGIVFLCDMCGQYFPDRRSLWKHKNWHVKKTQLKIYKCDVCGKLVSSPHSLRKHRSQHIQPYVCDVCGESFHRASGLQIHKYLHVR